MLKKELEILEEILNGDRKSNIGRPCGTFKYSDAQHKFLKENKDKDQKELIGMFNEKFKTQFSLESRALYNFMIRSGIIESNFKKEYRPRTLKSIENQLRTKEENMLKELNVIGDDDGSEDETCRDTN